MARERSVKFFLLQGYEVDITGFFLNLWSEKHLRNFGIYSLIVVIHKILKMRRSYKLKKCITFYPLSHNITKTFLIQPSHPKPQKNNPISSTSGYFRTNFFLDIPY